MMDSNEGTVRARYTTLDMLRGLAALAVVLRHYGQQFHTWQPTSSYLAVDLFFALSGFVLSANYDAKFAAGLTIWQFMRARLIRLFPLAFLGAALGGVWLLAAHELTPAKALSAALAPTSVPWPWSTSSLLFPSNPPFWTLFFELWVANLTFACFWKYIKGWVLYGLIAAAAVGLILCERHFHYLDIGWNWDQLAGGVARVVFSFFVGIAIRRLQTPRTGGIVAPMPILVLGLMGILFFPLPGRLLQIGGLVYILFFIPALLYISAKSFDPFAHVSVFFGDVSYAIYTIHMPLIGMLAIGLGSFFEALSPAAFAGVEVTFLLCLIAVGAVLDRYFDGPTRQKLRLTIRNLSIA